MNDHISAYDQISHHLLDNGYSVIPIAPNTKRPGAFTTTRDNPQKHWRGMYQWERYSSRMPTELEVAEWNTWPDAGIGLVCGKLSRIIALDRDYDCPASDALEAIIPPSPVAKKGAKGYTKFYRYTGEESKSWDVDGVRVLDMLSDGRQTVMPPSRHPDGFAYVYITEDTLERMTADELPCLPADFYAQVDKVLKPYQTEKDQRPTKVSMSEAGESIHTGLSTAAEYYRDMNDCALQQLDKWVLKLVPTAFKNGEAYRCIATWRDCKNANVGIHAHGIMDWGGNYSHTAIDLVMRANGVDFAKASEMLRALIHMPDDDEEFTMTAPMSEPPALFVPSETTVELKPVQALPAFLKQPPGILGVVTQWINATAPKQQHEFAVAGAIALAATVMQRVYRSNRNNFTSLYFLLVGKSTEGKDYPLSAVPAILTAAGLSNLIAGSGYTSPAAVYSELLRKPSHLVCIDEFGKHLKMSRQKGNAASEGALDKLVEAFGRLHGEMRPQVYSSMTLPKGQQTAVDRVIYNPAISLIAASTPDTFYGNLTDDIVHDGMLGRFIVVESIQPRQLLNEHDFTPIPDTVIAWCKAVHQPHTGDLADVMTAEMPAATVPMQFEDACKAQLRAFEVEINDAKTAAEGEGLDMLLGRSVEKAMRLAMIVAKALDPNSGIITTTDLDWAIKYVKHYDYLLLDGVKNKRTRSEMDGLIKKMVRYIEAAHTYKADKRYGKILEMGGMPAGQLLRLMKIDARTFNLAVGTAVESGIIGRYMVEGFKGDVFKVIEEN